MVQKYSRNLSNLVSFSLKIKKIFILISESKPQPPPKPQLPPPKEDTEKIQINLEPNQSNPVKMERAKSFVNVHKISNFQSNRIVPNDDLVLNQVKHTFLLANLLLLSFFDIFCLCYLFTFTEFVYRQGGKKVLLDQWQRKLLN